jgi:hypothetical protein
MIFGYKISKVYTFGPSSFKVGKIGPWEFKKWKIAILVLGLWKLDIIGPLEHFGKFQFQPLGFQKIAKMVLLINKQNQPDPLYY